MNPLWIRALRRTGLRGRHFAGLARWLRPLSQSNLAPKGLVRWIPVNTTFRVAIAPDLSFRYSLSTSWTDGYGRALYWHGLKGVEPETIRVFLQFVRNARLFLDVGCHTGVYSLVACALNPSLRVIAFEPVPEVRCKLVENLEVNHFEQRCIIRSEALSDYSGSAKFHVPVSRDMASLDPQGFRGLPGKLIDVDVVTADSVIEPGVHVDLVKIDVEGFEDQVLRGMSRVLSDTRPRIIFECLTPQLAMKIADTLTRHGYQFFRIGPQGLESVEQLVPDEHCRYRNFLAEPVSRSALPTSQPRTCLPATSQ
jgi:FkbM family methyltransferase